MQTEKATPDEPTPTKITGEALERLLEHRNHFLGFLEKRVGSRATAEDILQSAFVRGIERGGAIRDEETVVAWFYRLLRNAVIDYYRQRESSDRLLEEWARELEACDVPYEMEKEEVCGCVTELLNELKPEYRLALETVDIAEGSLRDLADRAGISAGNAAVRVHRAREALRKQVQLTCGVCAEHGCVDCRCNSGCGPGH
jgi:RNA polymerase sigma-70 factor (ECF subfamily)